MQYKVGWGYGQQHAGHAADHEGDHEGDGPHHGQLKTDLALVHGEQPVEYFRTRRDGNNHCGNTEEGIHAGPATHGEEVVQPHQVGKNGNNHGGVHHGAVTKQTLAAERRHHFREHTEQRQNQDVNLGVTPNPDQVHVHHGVATKVVREEVGAQIAVHGQHAQHGGQHRESGNNQHVGTQRSPGENRHFHHGHAGGAHLDHGHDQVHTRKQSTHPCNL